MYKFFLFSILLFACSSPTEKPETIHNFQVQLDLTQLPTSVSSIRGQLSNSNSDLILFDFALDTISHSASATVSEISVGEWNLSVNAFDENEIVTHSASTTILLHSGLNEVNLVFEAVTGDLVITVNSDKIMLYWNNFWFYKYEADSLIEIKNADPDSLIELYRPMGKTDRALSFKLLNNNYVEFISLDRFIQLVDTNGVYSDFLNTGNHIFPLTRIAIFADYQFLPELVWQSNYDYSDMTLEIAFKDSEGSSVTNIIFVILPYYPDQGSGKIDSQTGSIFQSIRNKESFQKFKHILDDNRQ